MHSLPTLLTLSLSTHTLALNLALAATIEHNSRVTPTITKTIYHTEVRRLSTHYSRHLGRSGSAIHSKSAASFIERIHENESDHAASSISTAHFWPRKPGGEKPTIPQLPATGVPGIINTRETESSNDATKRDYTVDLELETANKRNNNLYNLRADLAPEGYISVYIPNSTASTFCESETEQASEDLAKARELHLTVVDATKTVAIPIHGEAVASFCLKFRNAENMGSATTERAAASSATTISLSAKENTTKVSSTEESSGSTTGSFKHTSSKSTASEIDSNTSTSPTVPSSTSKMKSSNTEETSDGSQTSKSKRRTSVSKTSSDTDLITPASATDISSKTKTKSSASEPDKGFSETFEYRRTSKKTKSKDDKSLEVDTSTNSHSTNTKSKTPKAEDTKDPSNSTASLKKGPSSQTISTDPDTSSSPIATPLALPASTSPNTTTDEPFTMSNMNTWYESINSYLETAQVSTATVGSTDQTSLQTTNSARTGLRRRVEPTAALKRARGGMADASMHYTSDYSWMGDVSTKLLSGSATASVTASSVVSANAAMKRPILPFVWWRRDNAESSIVVLDARKKARGPDYEPERENKGLFKISVDEETTRISTETSGVVEEKKDVLATKLAHKQQDSDADDEYADVRNEAKEGEEAVADEDQTAKEEAELEEGETGDGDEESTSTHSEPSRTKMSEDDDDSIALSTDESGNANEDSTSRKKEPADYEEATPTSESTPDTSPEDEDNAPANDDDDAEELTEEPPTTSSKKPKSTKSSTTSDSDEEDAEHTPSTKSKSSIPSLAPGISFAFPSTTAVIQATPSPLPTPPPSPTDPASAPMSPIIWDPDCPQLSTSTFTVQNSVTREGATTVGLGCWRLVPPNNSSSGSPPSHAPSIFTTLSISHNKQLGVLCWMIAVFIVVQFTITQYQYLYGQWHAGRGLVWWILGLEMWGLGVGFKERMEEAEREWERAEWERESVKEMERERLAALAGRVS